MEQNLNSESEQITRFTNCKLCINGSVVEDDLWIRGEKIIDKQATFYIEKQTPSTIIDCNGLFLTPGLIETQINGSIGLDFSDLSEPGSYVAKLSTVRDHLLQYGVTSFCPTVITSDHHTYELIADLLVGTSKEPLEGILGFHYEGPFLAEKYAGAHRKQLLRSAARTENLTDLYGNLKHVKMITLAPELVSTEVISMLVEMGITVSIGHTDCSYEQAREAIEHGASAITHLYSCMRSMHHREPGVIGTLTLDNPLHYGFITDGIHVHSPVIRSTYKTNPAGMVLVTDASSTAGFPLGIYISNGQRVEVKEDRVVLEGTNTLAGSNTNIIQCLRTLKSAAGVTLAEAIKCASENPATMLGIHDEVGFLRSGAQANIVLMDANFSVVIVFYKGKVVYKSSP